MKLQVVIVLITVGYINPHCSNSPCRLASPIEGYYWREYAGAIPYDAFPGGIDYNGRSIYIGQVFFENNLIVGKIYESDHQIYFGIRNKEFTATQHVKILCSQNPENFIWINTTGNGLSLLTNRHLVVGGRNGDFILYVGRLLHHYETTVAKVAVHDKGKHAENGIWITYKGSQIYYEAFEVLAYSAD